MKQQALIVFFKTPVLGAVKTRLAKDIGDCKALEVYVKMLGEVMNTAYAWELAGDGRQVLAFGAGDSSTWHQFGIKKGYQQVGQDLGEKMQHAMKFALMNHDQVAIIGTDSPDLKVCEIEASFSMLDQTDTVFGPCQDGGYYLMACHSLPPTLLWDLPWSTETTLKRLLARCEGFHLSSDFLEPKIDIDTLEDLKKHDIGLINWELK